MRAPLAPPRLSLSRKVDAEAHAVETSWATDSPDARIARFSDAMSSRVDQLVIDGGNRVLPDQLLVGDLRTEIPRDGSHVAVGELVPGAGEGVGELVGVLEETPRDRLVDRVHPQCEVRRQHDGGVPLRRVVSVRHRVRGCGIRRNPLPRAGRALHQIPVVAEQRREETVVPPRRGGCPGTLEPAGDRVIARAAAEGVLPAEALLLDARAFGFATDVLVRVGGTVGLAEGMPAGDEGDRLLVVHCHARERLANIPGRGKRTRDAVGPLGIHVDQAHLHRAERIGELPVTAVALVSEPGVLGSPVDVLFGLPDVRAPATETERLETHRLEGDVPGENHEVGPGDLPAVLLFDRPEQAARLVEVRVVGPAVERGEALRARAATAAAVVDAVGAGAVPRHPNEERPVVAVVSRPPVLRRRHHLFDVRLHGIEVEALELRRVVELHAHWIDQRGVLAERRADSTGPATSAGSPSSPTRCDRGSIPGTSLPARPPHRSWRRGRCLRWSSFSFTPHAVGGVGLDETVKPTSGCRQGPSAQGPRRVIAFGPEVGRRDLHPEIPLVVLAGPEVAGQRGPTAPDARARSTDQIRRLRPGVTAAATTAVFATGDGPGVTAAATITLRFVRGRTGRALARECSRRCDPLHSSATSQFEGEAPRSSSGVLARPNKRRSKRGDAFSGDAIVLGFSPPNFAPRRSARYQGSSAIMRTEDSSAHPTSAASAESSSAINRLTGCCGPARHSRQGIRSYHRAIAAKSSSAVITPSSAPARANVTGKPGNCGAAITLPPAHPGGPWRAPTRLADAAATRFSCARTSVTCSRCSRARGIAERPVGLTSRRAPFSARIRLSSGP